MKGNSSSRRTRPRLALIGAASLIASGTASANFTCEGKVGYLGLSPDGVITVNVGFGTWYICDQTAGNGSFSPAGCKTWYSTILAAKLADQSVRFFFASSIEANNGAACTALGSWVWPNPAPYHMNVM